MLDPESDGYGAEFCRLEHFNRFRQFWVVALGEDHYPKIETV
jgi:hypothetical protein